MPGRGALIRLQFPLGGLDKRFSYRDQPPFTTPDCLNVRPNGTIEGRARGGSRSGLVKAYPQQLGGGEPIRLMDSVTVVKDDGLRYAMDTFPEQTIGGDWSAIDGSTIPPILPTSEDDIDFTLESVAAAYRNIDIDTTQEYSVEIFISPYIKEGDTDPAHHGRYHLYAKMTKENPNYNINGIEAILTLTSEGDATASGTEGYYTWEIKSDGTSVRTGYGTTEAVETSIFTMLIDGSRIRLVWAGVEIYDSNDFSGDALNFGAPAFPYSFPLAFGQGGSSRTGFGMVSTVAAGITLVDSFVLHYYIVSKQTSYREIFLASANGQLYKSDTGDWQQLSEIANTPSLRSDVSLQATELLQKLYIADYGERVFGTDGAISGVNLTAPGVSDWTDLDSEETIETDGDVCVITNGTGDVVDGTYKLSSVTAGNVVFVDPPGDGDCDYNIQRAPKVYDPVTDTLAIWSTDNATNKGAVPTGCKGIVTYRGRITLVDDPQDMHNWYQSRQFDAGDFYYGASSEDAQRAVAGGNSNAGKIGEPIRAVIAHNDDYLIFLGIESAWVLRGDAALNGQIDKLSDVVGGISANAYARGPEDELVFLTRDGLYSVPVGINFYPKSWSREKLPRELLNIDRDQFTVNMEYDVVERGVRIFLTPVGTGAVKHYFLDWETKTYWPDVYASDHEPTSTIRLGTQIRTESALLLGCHDGYIRRYNDKSSTDDGVDFDTHVIIGPVRAGGNDYEEGQLTELIGTLARTGKNNQVQWDILAGDSHDEAIDSSSQATGNWSAGQNNKDRPNIRGGSIAVKLTGIAGAGRWAVEKIVALIRSVGPQRKRT